MVVWQWQSSGAEYVRLLCCFRSLHEVGLDVGS